MKKYIHNSVWFGSLYIGIAFSLLYTGIRRNAYLKGDICKLDYGVFLMKPLQYTLLMTLPLILSTYLMYRNEFSYAFVIRWESWQKLLLWQRKKSMVSSFFYAAVFIGLVCLTNKRIPIYNWNIQGSYYFFQTHRTLSLHSAEVIFYLFLMCGIRNFIIENILLFSIWKNSFLQGVGCICGISCFEIAQRKYQVLYRLISSDYPIWADPNSRLEIFMVTGGYFLIGYFLFRICISKKEIIEHR